jgi:hypothetical protein
MLDIAGTRSPSSKIDLAHPFGLAGKRQHCQSTHFVDPYFEQVPLARQSKTAP